MIRPWSAWSRPSSAWGHFWNWVVMWRAVLTKEDFGEPFNIYSDCVAFLGKTLEAHATYSVLTPYSSTHAATGVAGCRERRSSAGSGTKQNFVQTHVGKTVPAQYQPGSGGVSSLETSPGKQ